MTLTKASFQICHPLPCRHRSSKRDHGVTGMTTTKTGEVEDHGVVINSVVVEEEEVEEELDGGVIETRVRKEKDEEETVEMVIVVAKEKMETIMVANYWAIYLQKMKIKFGFVCILSLGGQNTCGTTVFDRGGSSKSDTTAFGGIVPCL